MLTVIIAAHITLNGALRLPGTVISLVAVTAKNLIASGYAYLAPSNAVPDLVMASAVVVLDPVEDVPPNLLPGTVILRRPV